VIQIRRDFHRERLVRPVAVVALDEVVEARLLLASDRV